MRCLRLTLIVAAVVLITSCGVQKDADRSFGDQNLKTAIALIELHKTRTGAYPESLNDLKYTGEWDKNALARVSYTKLQTGYELDIEVGWVGKPELRYPADFWKGLGLVKSNVKPEAGSG